MKKLYLVKVEFDFVILAEEGQERRIAEYHVDDAIRDAHMREYVAVEEAETEYTPERAAKFGCDVIVPDYGEQDGSEYAYNANGEDSNLTLDGLFEKYNRPQYWARKAKEATAELKLE